MRGNQARVKNADVRHPSSTVVMHRRKSASPVHNVLRLNKSAFALDLMDVVILKCVGLDPMTTVIRDALRRSPAV